MSKALISTQLALWRICKILRRVSYLQAVSAILHFKSFRFLLMHLQNNILLTSWLQAPLFLTSTSSKSLKYPKFHRETLVAMMHYEKNSEFFSLWIWFNTSKDKMVLWFKQHAMSNNSAMFCQALSFSLFGLRAPGIRTCWKYSWRSIINRHFSKSGCLILLKSHWTCVTWKKSRNQDTKGVTFSSVQEDGQMQPHSQAFLVKEMPIPILIPTPTTPEAAGWTRGDAGRCGAHPGTHRLAMPALRTAVEMALMAVQRELRSCVNSPLPFARRPSSITKRVMVMTLVSKVERSVMVAVSVPAAASSAFWLSGAGRGPGGRGRGHVRPRQRRAAGRRGQGWQGGKGSHPSVPQTSKMILIIIIYIFKFTKSCLIHCAGRGEGRMLWAFVEWTAQRVDRHTGCW